MKITLKNGMNFKPLSRENARQDKREEWTGRGGQGVIVDTREAKRHADGGEFQQAQLIHTHAHKDKTFQ